MRLTVFTSNQPRHIALLDALVTSGHDVVAVIEPKTMVLPTGGVMRDYWSRVRLAEVNVFGMRLFTKARDVMALVPGELSAFLDDKPLNNRLPIVFSSSYIRGPAADALIAAGALNLHVGIAPEYRGSAPNMWAWYDGNAHLIGAQVQRLSKGLDAGDILAEAYSLDGDYFTRSMRAVKFGIEALVRLLATPEPWPLVRANDRTQQIRYSKHSDFDEAIATKILQTA